MTNDTSFPAYVYAPKNTKAVNDVCANETTARLKEFITPGRIVEITDNSYLKRELENTSIKKAVLFLPGGETRSLDESLKSLQVEILNKISSGWNAVGFCSGANVLCSSLIVKMEVSSSTNYYSNCVPVFAYAPNPLPYDDLTPLKDYYGSLVTIKDQETKETFSSFWYWGSGFNIAFYDEKTYGFVSLAEYPNCFYKTACFKAKRDQGTIIGSGFHPEIEPMSVVNHYNSSVMKETDFLREFKTQVALEPEASQEGRRKFLTKIFKEVGIEKE